MTQRRVVLGTGFAVGVAWLVGGSWTSPARGADDAVLPAGVRVVWDLEKAVRETTPSRQRISINGLWRWQPAGAEPGQPPTKDWGYFKVPGSWPGINDYMQHDCQTLFAHPSWQQTRLGELSAAWYQREVSIPAGWSGRRIGVSAEYLNSYAVVHVDGKTAGEMRFPAGEVDLTEVCRPGAKQVLSIYVAALPLRDVMTSFSDTASSRRTKGTVQRRGLCGDLCLFSRPVGARIEEVRVDTSVRRGEVVIGVALAQLDPAAQYTVRAEILDQGRSVLKLAGKPLGADSLQDGRIRLSAAWKPEKLWDIHTPENQYQARVWLEDADGKTLDTSHATRFGFREFWIDGRDFYLNGSRIFLCALPLDNAQVGAAWASYDGARESLLRLKGIGINFVYTHNYGCEPGTHLGFAEILRAADDVGMLIALSQPHFGQYDWQAADADRKNGYAQHAAFYVRAAGSHPSVVLYSMSHNATGYSEDMNPDLIDGRPESDPRDSWALNNARRAVRAEAIVKRMDPARIVYHHSSGNLGSMHTVNFYTNMAPIQELDDWFEHWATRGVKPFFSCEYMVPCTWDWTMYRGWYNGAREFGSAVVPWEFCVAEWSSQFLGDRAYRISDEEKQNLRWEARQFRSGRLWHRWDYPHQVGSPVFESQHTIIGRYLASNWRAFRTWGVSAISPWEHDFFWSLRPGTDKGRRQLPVDWDKLQRPGFSADYIDRQYERMDLAFQQSDWFPTADGQAILRNNRPLLAYLAGKPGAFTSKDHNFTPGQTVEKQLIVINNSRRSVTGDCQWSLGLPQAAEGKRQITVATGQQERIPLEFKLPETLAPGRYELRATVRFSTGETQRDSFALDVLPVPPPVSTRARIALWDPKGETARLLAARGVAFQPVDAAADLSAFDLLVVGKGALAPEGRGPDLRGVREGLTVLVFEQTAEALEQRLGFRVAEYGLRQVFQRLPDHPTLAGLGQEHLQDWRGAATLLPPRLQYEPSRRYAGSPVVRWCGLEVPRVWRCGNRGNVASVLIEKPARGDFLPILEGGYSLQYTPLVEYREGKGRVLFCQLDLTGRTEEDPAAERFLRNLLSYATTLPATEPGRRALYAGDAAGREHLALAGVSAAPYEGGAIPPGQVLIVGTGAGKRLAEDSRAVDEFLKAGGRLLLLGLDEQEANAFLPFTVRMKRAEHIAGWFEPPAASSLLAGISPADIHNRDPREISLVASGAKILAGGVLAEQGGVVFFQLPPYTISSAQGVLPSFVVDAQEAQDGKRSALVTLGTTAGAQFGQKVALQPQVGKTYTLAALVKGVGGPIRARLEVERAGRPWDRAVKGPETLLAQDRWTDLHVSFRCQTPFPEGWQAYIASAQDGGRFRVDQFRLYEGAYVPFDEAQAKGAKNLLANPSFETGPKPWYFTFSQQHNLRRTFRRTSVALARVLSNLGVQGETPLVARFAIPVGGDQEKPRPSVLRNGDFIGNRESNAAAGSRLSAEDRPPAGRPGGIALLKPNSQGPAEAGAPEPWQVSSSGGKAVCTRESAEGKPALRLSLAEKDAKGRTSVMLAQHDVPVREGQWYRISLRAKAEGLANESVSLAIQDTKTWTSLIEYLSFRPTGQWRTYQFVVEGKGTTDRQTRFQIWHGSTGSLWLAEVSMTPTAAPSSEGRWSQGLYLDQPEEWDDPYRFFRW